MKNLLSIRNFLIAIPLLVLLVALNYALPQVDVVRAVGVEIKRMDGKDSGGAQNQTRDVYFLQAETPSGDPKVYRNEDNFIYGKFDSADLQAQVQSLAADKQLIAVRHYGWRVTLFSMFPNAVKAWPVEEGYRHIPIFNIVVLAALGLLAFLIYRRVSKTVTRAREALENQRAERAERAEREAVAAREAKEAEEAAALASRQTEQKKDDDVDAFLNSDGNKQD